MARGERGAAKECQTTRCTRFSTGPLIGECGNVCRVFNASSTSGHGSHVWPPARASSREHGTRYVGRGVSLASQGSGALGSRARGRSSLRLLCSIISRARPGTHARCRLRATAGRVWDQNDSVKTCAHGRSDSTYGFTETRVGFIRLTLWPPPPAALLAPPQCTRRSAGRPGPACRTASTFSRRGALARRVRCAVCGVRCAAGAALLHRVLHVLFGARAHALLLRGGQRLATEGDYALAKATLHQPVEHAQRVLQLHLLELLQHRCDKRERQRSRSRVGVLLQARGTPCFSTSEPWSRAPAMAFMSTVRAVGQQKRVTCRRGT